MTPPPLAVSMGDPAGVGLEIAVRTWATRGADTPPYVLLADAHAVQRAMTRAGVAGAPVEIKPDAWAQAAQWFHDGLPVAHQPMALPETPGAPTPANGPAIIAAIDAAVAAVRAGDAAAVVTLPIAKSTLYAAGFGYPGHTEYVAHLCADMPMSGPRGPVMLLATGDIRVALATIHVPLTAVAQLLTRETVDRTARVVLHALMRDFAIARPRLVLAGLNPHAGEQGALGREEIEIIAPVAAALRAEGHDVAGPLPADTLFHAEARARYDAVIAMYHDQGLIPIKTIDFWGAANVTLGLPIIRTSPDHGTGFDIAGRGVAHTGSFMAALRTASAMAQRRARSE
ncbi:MAG: 4-hydroxythreonine-4-phosphate dehydrogenase PdxA [Hyphomonadaceae bacterium]|nr:4-hydroxythreonine-4-phosphate dehydrogenase PdxA [Hyphomonadaceae bacterium]